MPQIGETAPDFELMNQDGKPVRLSDYRGQRVVVFAFTKAGTPGCTAQACAFRDEFDELRAANATVLTISPDTVEALAEFKRSRNLPYDLLADLERTILTAWGAYGASVFGLFKLPMTAHSLWVIDEQGVVLDAKVGVPPGAVNQALATLRKQPA
ncbi:MAG: peroxiredoxin [Chloroflexota bacterium]|nr:peroxiredoxin [Chloroflexota bacterium]